MLRDLYDTLKTRFGARANPDIWWPIYCGRTESPAFERAITNILVQQSQWARVRRAVALLDAQDLLTAQALAHAFEEVIAACVKPVGFQLQKAGTLRRLGSFVVARFGTEAAFCAHVRRDQLLTIRGIGEETADRILLYTCGRLAWPVDTYCLRVLAHYQIIPGVPTSPALKKRLAVAITAMVNEEMPPQLDDWQRLHALMQLDGEARRQATSSTS